MLPRFGDKMDFCVLSKSRLLLADSDAIFILDKSFVVWFNVSEKALLLHNLADSDSYSGKANDAFDVSFIVQTDFHIFLHNRKLDFHRFKPLTVLLTILVNMDFGEQGFHKLSSLRLIHNSVQLFKINQDLAMLSAVSFSASIAIFFALAYQYPRFYHTSC
mgnify:CR=1 FL=1|jgi:hypothetical protein